MQELARYRSEFFGKLREIIGDRPDIRIVGDRFVFQSEVLFDAGSAEFGDAAKAAARSRSSRALKEIAAKIPKDLNWVLRVDGHTDRRPISNAQFASNWELSAARAISVVRYMISQGIPANRLAAAGFADNQPLDTGGRRGGLSPQPPHRAEADGTLAAKSWAECDKAVAGGSAQCHIGGEAFSHACERVDEASSNRGKIVQSAAGSRAKRPAPERGEVAKWLTP